MAVRRIKLGGQPAFQWGPNGTAFVYDPNDAEDEARAKQKAQLFGRAVKAAQKRARALYKNRKHSPPTYPAKVEQDYTKQLVARARAAHLFLMEQLKPVLKKLGPGINERAKRADAFTVDEIMAMGLGQLLDEVRHLDSVEGDTHEVLRVVERSKRAFSKGNPPSKGKIGAVARGIDKNANQDLDRDVQRVAQISIFKPGKDTDAARQFIRENVSLISSIDQQYHDQVAEHLEEALRLGRNVEDLAKEIEGRYNVAESRARLIARDQVGKFNGQVRGERQVALDAHRYQWMTVGDERVRESHRAVDGKIFDWDKPPDVGGRSLHPGQDYQCRCTAAPVWDDEDVVELIKEAERYQATEAVIMGQPKPDPIPLPVPRMRPGQLVRLGNNSYTVKAHQSPSEQLKEAKENDTLIPGQTAKDFPERWELQGRVGPQKGNAVTMTHQEGKNSLVITGQMKHRGKDYDFSTEVPFKKVIKGVEPRKPYRVPSPATEAGPVPKKPKKAPSKPKAKPKPAPKPKPKKKAPTKPKAPPTKVPKPRKPSAKPPPPTPPKKPMKIVEPEDVATPPVSDFDLEELAPVERVMQEPQRFEPVKGARYQGYQRTYQLQDKEQKQVRDVVRGMGDTFAQDLSTVRFVKGRHADQRVMASYSHDNRTIVIGSDRFKELQSKDRTVRWNAQRYIRHEVGHHVDYERKISGKYWTSDPDWANLRPWVDFKEFNERARKAAADNVERLTGKRLKFERLPWGDDRQVKEVQRAAKAAGVKLTPDELHQAKFELDITAKAIEGMQNPRYKKSYKRLLNRMDLEESEGTRGLFIDKVKEKELLDQGWITDYSRYNEGEDFAENFSIWNMSPDTYEEMYPREAAYFKKRFGDPDEF